MDRKYLIKTTNKKKNEDGFTKKTNQGICCKQIVSKRDKKNKTHSYNVQSNKIKQTDALDIRTELLL